MDASDWTPSDFVDGRGNPLRDPTSLFALELRYLLTDRIASAGRVVTVAEPVGWLDHAGFRVGGRPSKTVSDHLRAEIARGRVRRVGRGRYVVDDIPGATRRRIGRVARYRFEQVARSWSAPGDAGLLGG